MKTRIDGLGVLTLATPNDYLKAIGLALSLRVSNPGLPVAVACSAAVMPLLAPYFDHVIEELPGLRGFVHKVHLDTYSPFSETLFFDSDVLVFKTVRPYLARWGQRPYTACGTYMQDGVSAFGLDRAMVLQRIHKAKMVVIDGAGHAYFQADTGRFVFDRAREVTANYSALAGPIKYADEDVMNIVMTQLDLPPAPYEDFFSRFLSARPGTLDMDASRAVCTFVAANTGQPFSPCMMHFANNEGALEYTRQLLRLFAKFDVPRGGLMKQGLSDVFTHKLRDPASRGWRSVKKLVGA
jgi:hypothetical protein